MNDAVRRTARVLAEIHRELDAADASRRGDILTSSLTVPPAIPTLPPGRKIPRRSSQSGSRLSLAETRKATVTR